MIRQTADYDLDVQRETGCRDFTVSCVTCLIAAGHSEGLAYLPEYGDLDQAVLSALTLGLSVDFAIHFLERAREEQRRTGSWKEAIRQMFKEPAMAISRNAITISIGFTPLLVAPLVPYRTVGFFLATIMAVSWLATLFILPALMTALARFLFKTDAKATEETPS